MLLRLLTFSSACCSLYLTPHVVAEGVIQNELLKKFNKYWAFECSGLKLEPRGTPHLHVHSHSSFNVIYVDVHILRKKEMSELDRSETV